MSAKVAKLVLSSALPPHLRLVAVVMALFGDEHGESIYPSVDRVARMMRVDVRTAKRQLRQLRGLGVLVPMSEADGGRLPGGRGRSVVYRLDTEALMLYLPVKGDTSVTPNSDTDVTFSASETVTPASRTVTPASRTVTPASRNGDTGVTRSTERSSEGSTERSGERTTGADAPGFRSRSSKEKPKPKGWIDFNRIITSDPRLAYMARGRRQASTGGPIVPDVEETKEILRRYAEAADECQSERAEKAQGGRSDV